MAKKQPETLFKERVVKILKRIPNLWYTKVQQVAIIGTPDLMICYRGAFVAWELKTDKGKASPLQLHNIDQINKAGGIARLVAPSNLDAMLEELRTVGQPSPHA